MIISICVNMYVQIKKCYMKIIRVIHPDKMACK
jgi:hypothetical protein